MENDAQKWVQETSENSRKHSVFLWLETLFARTRVTRPWSLGRPCSYTSSRGKTSPHRAARRDSMVVGDGMRSCMAFALDVEDFGVFVGRFYVGASGAKNWPVRRGKWSSHNGQLEIEFHVDGLPGRGEEARSPCSG